MKKLALSVVTGLFLSIVIFAQQAQHKIVFDFTQGDTSSFALMIRHAKKIIELTGNAQLEVVCHGPGLDMLVKERSTVQKEIEQLRQANVIFAACEATMKRRGIAKSQLLPDVITVPAAILELSSKQQDGWSYVKED